MATIDIMHCIFSIVLTLITITSFLTLYQLFSGIFCRKIQAATSTQRDLEISENPSSVSVSNSTSFVSTTTPHEPIHKFFKYTALITCTTFSIMCLLINIDRIIIFTVPEQHTPLFSYFIFSLYFMGRMFLCLIFIGRLHFTFQGSRFGYSRCNMITLKLVWCLMPIIALLSVMLSMSPTTILIGMMCGTVMILVDILLSIALLFMYLKKIYHLIYIKDDTIVAIMTKYSLLYTICFVSTFVVIAVFMFQLTMVSSSGEDLALEDVNVFLSFDSLINLICLYLNLNLAKKWYHTLCGYLDGKFTACCDICSNGLHHSEPILESGKNNDTDCTTSPVKIEKINVKIQSTETGNTAIII